MFLLPYYRYPDNPVLLFLHGIGEAFNPLREAKPGQPADLARIRHANLFQQGVPKYLNRVPNDPDALNPDHPLRRAFTVVAPQLPDRATPWLDALDDVKNIVANHRSANGKLYVLGFSKGGLGALLLAARLNANAVITIDASPMNNEPEDAASRARTALGQIPLWAIYTNYAYPEGFEKIYRFNELLTENRHADLTTQPAEDSQSRTFVKAPADKKTEIERHGWICDQATEATAPYEWLLKH